MAQAPASRLSRVHVAPPVAATLEDGLRETFGFGEFRPGQRDVMEAVVAGHNALVVMPTGSGKSLCYQLPALVLDGVTIVISPLIALMKDQVDALQTLGVPATYINSSLSASEQRDRIAGMEMGQFKLVYVAPERFRSDLFCDALSGTKVSLLAIDEAHCISQWGHDFRPDYLQISKIHKMLGAPTTIALTATATRQVQDDILAQLNLPAAEVFVYGFERPNLFLEVYDTRSKVEKFARMKALLDHFHGEPCLVYCATRKQVEEVQDELTRDGYAVGAYHGGLSDGERERVQDAFMNDDTTVLVATNAFGMGVDKPNIRGIVHYNMPGSLEAYYQEAGRAGRDRQPSHCLLLFNYADRGIHEFFTDQTYPTQSNIERVWEHLTRAGVGTHYMTVDELTRQLNRRSSQRMNSWGVESAMRLLKRGGHVDFGARDGVAFVEVCDLARVRDLRVDWEYVQDRRRVNLDLLTDVIRYASGRTCRQLYLLRYFNSKPSFQGGCGHCGVCTREREYVSEEQQRQPRMTLKVDDDAELLVRKLLSGVARARGRRGAHVVAAMLRGSRSQAVTTVGMDRLSTYGLLKSIKQQDLVALLDMCHRFELLQRDDHGCIYITELGTNVMAGREPAPAALIGRIEPCLKPSRRARRSAPSASAAAKPTAAKPASAATSSDDGEDEGGGVDIDSTYAETLTMLHEGMTPAAIAEAREMTMQTISRHLMVLASEGHRFDLSEHIDEKLLKAVRVAITDWSYGEPLAPIKRQAPSCTYDDLKLHIAQALMDRQA